jgi:chromosome segregation ATPase
MSSVEDDNLKKTNVVNNTNNVDKELLQNPFVKDLLVKIDVLKNGIIKERKINAELSSKLKKFEADLTSKIIKLEEELVSKTSQIKILIQEKIDLEKKLKQQQSKRTSGFFDVFNININPNEKKVQNSQDPIANGNLDPNSVEAVSSMANAEIRKLYEEISQLKFENQTYLQKMNDTMEQSENAKLELKNEIKAYTNKIKSYEDEMKMLKEEKDELQDRIKLTATISSQTLKETEHFKSLLLDYRKGKEDAVNQLNEWIEKCKKLSTENEKYKNENERLEKDSLKMAQKLSELKNYYIKINLRNQMFHVRKVGLISSTEIDIIFGRGEYGNYVMRIDSNNEMEIINIQDVEYVRRVEKTKNKVEISYMLNGKKYDIVVLVPELVVDQFVEAYKNFYFESMKTENQISF